MSGHSKFANIKHKKEKNDAKKGKIFTIIGREIVIAVKEGGPDPENNSKLRDVIAKAKANNMPNDTIDRGIKKAAGDANADNYERITYEGYGPNGIAIIVETLTDNKIRTAANVISAFTKGNGSVGTPGCVSYMFDKKGQIIIGALVLQYPESYLLGDSNEKGEVEIKGLHIPARQQLVFQCLGYEMKALPFQEVKQHPNVRLKEKITELPEAVVLAQPLPRLLALTHKQLYKKYPAKKEYVRYYAHASYYKSVECKGHCVNLRHEYGLFI